MIFLSYSHSDKFLVSTIAEALEKVFGREKVFFDQWSIQPGDAIMGKMNSALEMCSFFFFLVSKNSLSSKMVTLEWQSALYKSVRGEVKFIPIKMDDCVMPAILLQNLYINLYGDGIEFAIRQIVDVISGVNTYKSSNGFQNVRAYISEINNVMKLEFRAEAYREPHSKYLILHENSEKEMTCRSLGSEIYHTQFLKEVELTNGKKYSAFIINRSEATSPKFPFFVEISAQGENPLKFIGVMKANSYDTFIDIPFIKEKQILYS